MRAASSAQIFPATPALNRRPTFEVPSPIPTEISTLERRIVVVTTPDGQTLTGVVRNEDNFSLQLQTADGTLHLLNRPELRSIEYQPRSLMPDDYASRLRHEELDDLVSYLLSVARNTNTSQAEQE